MSADSPAPAAEIRLTVACLCAQWCRTCDGYREVFDQVLSALDDARVQGMWVDVEDQADAMGAIDVENFPTLLMARGDEVLFFGPVTPHAQTLQRLIVAALQGGLSLDRRSVDPAVLELPARLRVQR
jgi:thioredoxin 1